MNRARVLYHLARADFLERVRGYGFWLMLFFAMALSYLFVPALDGRPFYATLVLGGYRPIYNSAWIGIMVALLMGEFMPLFGFYLVKGAIARDLRTGVGQIMAATPMSRPIYTLGKWLSNVAVLAAMVGAMIAACALLQFVRGEDLSLDLWALAAPLVIGLLPALALVGAVAVLFESIGWLAGGLGSVVYFFLAYPLLWFGLDLSGANTLYPSVYRACAAHFASCNASRQIDLNALPLFNLPTFRYAGMDWTADIVLARLGLLIVAAALAALAAVFFHRFDPALAAGHSRLFGQLRARVIAFVVEQTPGDEPQADPPAPLAGPVRLAPLPAQRGASGVSLRWQLCVAEWRLAMQGVRWWWYLGAAALIVGPFLASVQIAHLVLLPLAWLWPILLWSAMGTREVRHGMAPLAFTGPHPLRRQFMATWLAGMLITLALASGVLARLALAGQWATAAAVLLGTPFAPTLALALGCWSGDSKLFEGCYLFFWYMAAVQSIPVLDFMARFPQTVERGLPWVYAGLAALALAAASAGRRRQIVQ